MPLQAKRKSAAATRFEADGLWQLASSRVPVRFAIRVTALAVLALFGYPAFASWFHGLLILARHSASASPNCSAKRSSRVS